MSLIDSENNLIIQDSSFDEQFPLAPIDDYLIHQTTDPIRVMWSSDPRVYERYWAIAHDDIGELLLVTGGSFYPNLDTAEAFVILNLQGTHISIRSFRRLGADRMNMKVGPIRPKIVKGLRHWHYILEENEWGISYEFDWYDERRQIHHDSKTPIEFTKPRGRQGDTTAGFEGFGTVEGWVKVDGRKIELNRKDCRGTRDRHWGVGRGVGGPQFHIGRKLRPGWIGGNWIAFKNFAIWGNIVLYNFGDSRPGMGRVIEANRRLRFEDDTKLFVEGEIDYQLDDGTSKTVSFRRLGYQTAFMRCGLYGGTPDKNIYQGQYVGDSVTEGDKYDVTDPLVRKNLSGLNEHHCEIRCEDEVTTGILQPVEPDAYEACLANKPGWSFLD